MKLRKGWKHYLEGFYRRGNKLAGRYRYLHDRKWYWCLDLGGVVCPSYGPYPTLEAAMEAAERSAK